MLPDAAVTHYRHLCSEGFADGAQRLHEEQKAFDLKETGGRGAGYAARLAAIYVSEFKRSANIIADAIKEAHGRFNLSLSEDTQQAMLGLADKTLKAQADAFAGAYTRHIERFGLSSEKDCLGHQRQLSDAFVQTTLRRFFWTLENVPMPKDLPASTTMNFHGTVGAVQTGAQSTANVSQSWSNENVTAVVAALAQFKDLLAKATDVDAELRGELLTDIDSASHELVVGAPNVARISRWLGGIGATVQTVGSLQPAWDGVKACLRAIGLPL